MADGGQWRPLVASAEGTPSEDWPASPPFQSLHIDQRDDGRTLALLVGMAGRSHWSASVEIQSSGPCVSFDVACRVRGAQIGPLGSAYRLSEAPAGRASQPLAIELGGRFGPAVLEFEGDSVRVAAQVPEGCEPQTVRWDYRVLAP